MVANQVCVSLSPQNMPEHWYNQINDDSAKLLGFAGTGIIVVYYSMWYTCLKLLTGTHKHTYAARYTLILEYEFKQICSCFSFGTRLKPYVAVDSYRADRWSQLNYFPFIYMYHIKIHTWLLCIGKGNSLSVHLCRTWMPRLWYYCCSIMSVTQ